MDLERYRQITGGSMGGQTTPEVPAAADPVPAVPAPPSSSPAPKDPVPVTGLDPLTLNVLASQKAATPQLASDPGAQNPPQLPGALEAPDLQDLQAPEKDETNSRPLLIAAGGTLLVGALSLLFFFRGGASAKPVPAGSYTPPSPPVQTNTGMRPVPAGFTTF